MIFRSRLKSILATAPAAANTDVRLSLGLRKRYLLWISSRVSIAHHRHRICDTEKQRSLSRPFGFSWHPWVEPRRDRATTTTRTHAAGYISGWGNRTAFKTPKLRLDFLVTLGLMNDFLPAEGGIRVPLCVAAVASA